jgi:hypothetical protein
MTAETVGQVLCPQCGHAEGTNLSDGRRLCFSCRHEWNPAEQSYAPPAPEPAPSPRADDVLGPPAEVLEARAAQERLDALIGREVELEGGQVAMIAAFPDDDHVEVVIDYEGAESERVTVDFNDVVRSIVPAPAVVEVTDETALALAATNATIAGMAIQAGLACISGDGDTAVISTPAAGWLPEDPDTWTIVEQGLAYAVAVLVHAFELPRDQVAAIAADLINIEVTPTTKGESS